MENNDKKTGAEEQVSEPKTYTEEEVRKLLQQEGDRRVSEALKKSEKKIQERIEEAKKVAVMGEQEKFEYELKKKEEELQEREKALAIAENKSDGVLLLSEKKLPAEFISLVLSDDSSKMKEKVNLLEKIFKNSVKEEVEKRIAGTSPKSGTNQTSIITKKDFSKMTLREQADLRRDDPELYNELIK